MLKWKFVVVGAVAATGFGLLPDQKEGSMLALTVLPWLAWYADTLYRDYDLRIGTITSFIRGNRTQSWEYEMFLTSERAANKFPVLGMIAVLLPTVAVCLGVAAVGLFGRLGDLQKYWAITSVSLVAYSALIWSGLTCLVVTILFVGFHAKVYGRLNGRAVELFKQSSTTPVGSG